LEYGVTAEQRGIEKVLLAGWLLAEVDSPTSADGPIRAVSGGPAAAGLADFGGLPVSANTAVPMDLGALGAAAFTIDGNATPAPADQNGNGVVDIEDLAIQINGDAVLAADGVVASVKTVPQRPTAFSDPLAIGFTVGGAGALTVAGQDGQQFTVNFAGGETLDDVAAAIESASANGSPKATAAVRQTSTGEAFLEISLQDGTTPTITADPALAITNIDNADKIATEKQILEITRDDGAAPVIAGAGAQNLGLTDGTTVNIRGDDGDVLDTEDRVEVALKLLEDALQDFGAETLTSVRSSVGVDLARVDDVQTRINQFELFNEEVQTEIENTDIATAATQLSQSQLILESSFLAISSVSQLSLANFLR
ncbi:MAG: flagellin, partial [Pseudomonadota bacterium]